MNKKKQILELFEKYETETEFDGNAINNKQYSELAEKLLKLNILFVRNQRKLLIAFAEHIRKDMYRSDRISTLGQLVDDFESNL